MEVERVIIFVRPSLTLLIPEIRSKQSFVRSLNGASTLQIFQIQYSKLNKGVNGNKGIDKTRLAFRVFRVDYVKH